MTDFLTNFLHAININKLVNPPIADDLDIPDNTPTNIANGRLNQINRNANNDFFDDMAEQADQSNRERKKILFAAVRLGADRLALHRTLEHIQAKLRQGASVDQVFAQAQEYRRTQYREILREKAARIENGLKNIGYDEAKLAQLLVEGLPVGKGRPNQPGMSNSR